MFLSRAQEVALAALPHLDRSGPGGEGRGVKDLAEAAGVPAPFLQKVLGRLVDHGLLRSRRGRRGGFVLGRPAAEITLADIVLALGKKDDVEAAFRPLAGPAAPLFSRARRELLDTLRATRLADIPLPPPRA